MFFPEKGHERMNMGDMQSSISKTLLIPLAARAGEMKRECPIVQDKKAVEILAQIDIGDIIIDGGEIATLGILARTKVIDDEINKMLLHNPELTILNLGTGLDTRISRIDNGWLRCYELDLPDVINLRKDFFVENERIRCIAGSVLDSNWVKEVGKLDCDNTIIIAEGLFMYFSAQEVEQIFHMLSSKFPGAHMFFDVVHSYFVGKGISSNFQWGIDKSKDIEHLNPNIRLIKSWSIGDLLKERQSLLFRLMNVLPGTRNRSQILHICFESEAK